jgi:hypothetical protein
MDRSVHGSAWLDSETFVGSLAVRSAQGQHRRHHTTARAMSREKHLPEGVFRPYVPNPPPGDTPGREALAVAVPGR